MSNWDPEVSFAPFMGGCPVCGEPNGACKGESSYEGSIVFDDTPRRNNPFATFIVPRRVYVEEQVGKRTIKKLLYSAGQRITPEEARELGLLPPLA